MLLSALASIEPAQREALVLRLHEDPCTVAQPSLDHLSGSVERIVGLGNGAPSGGAMGLSEASEHLAGGLGIEAIRRAPRHRRVIISR